ncbi:hypothetical protein GGR52DRAFT_568542 [Hypoxylon sp. FL1284]|nr:hypothetical protein GGR52DRAFT_568542 [Hypoxylon sp. FL1284]
MTGDREPLLGRPTAREPPGTPETGIAITHQRKKTGRFGLPIIVLCRLFNTIFALCTIDKFNKDMVEESRNFRAHKLVFDFCWIILVWNIFTLAASIISCVFFPSSRHTSLRPRAGAGRSFKDKLHAQFAINDAVLALITLVLLVIACNTKRNPQDPRPSPPVVVMMSFLV